MDESQFANGKENIFFLRRRKSKLATRQRAKKSITKKSINQTTTKNPIHKEKHLTTKQQTANNCKTTKIIEKKNPLKILCNQPSTKPEPILMVLVQYLYSILTIHSVIRLLQNHYMLRIEICLKNFFCLSLSLHCWSI